jgi:hypothetical protein
MATSPSTSGRSVRDQQRLDVSARIRQRCQQVGARRSEGQDPWLTPTASELAVTGYGARGPIYRVMSKVN